MTQKIKLYAATYLMEICYGLFLLVAALLAAKVIASPFLVGLTGSLHVGTRIFGNVGFGRWSDRIGRKALLLPACVLFAVAFLLLRRATPGAIWGAYFLGGVANSIFWPLIEAWIGHGNNDEGLLRALGLFVVIFTVGIATGNLLGGLFMKIAPGTACLIGCLFLAAIIFLLALTEEAKGSPPPRDETGAPSSSKRVYLYLAWVANFATWIAVGTIRFLFPKLALKLGLPAFRIGLVNVILYLSWCFASLFFMHFKGWVYRLTPLILFQFLEVGALSLIWLYPTTFTFFVGFALFGAGAAMTYFASMFYGQDKAPDRGTKSGFHEMILGLGMLVGPLVGGGLAEVFTMSAPFAFCGLTVLGAIGLEVILYTRQTPKNGLHARAGPALRRP
ncbi:MAG: MFS transporter [Bacillota bacterium]